MLFVEECLSSLPHNPHYLKLYLKLIEKWSGSGKVSHHVLPKSMFPEYANLKKNEWNNSKLTHRQHFIVHRVLWKAFPESVSMFKAFYGMANKDKMKVDSRTYAKLREQHCEWNRNTKSGNAKLSQLMSENRKNGTVPTWNKGMRVWFKNPEEVYKKISEAKKGVKFSDEHKRAMAKSMSNKPRVSCANCKKELAAHHLNRHLNGTACR